MEENRFLDACHNAIAVILVGFMTASCSLPRIVVLRDPLTPEEHVNLGVAYERAGELDGALREYETATKKLPVAYLYIGNIRVQQKRYEEAEEAYRRAIEKDESAAAYNNLAWLYNVTGKDPGEAERLARKAVELSPGSEEFRDTLQKILEKAGKPGSTE
jgi:tetratricopeptide (TPR) repeat protein